MTFTNSTNNIMEHLICPLTHQIFIDPVSAPDKRVYERDAIEKWIEKNHNSPFTREPMEIYQLVDNIPIKNMLESIKGNIPNIQTVKTYEKGLYDVSTTIYNYNNLKNGYAHISIKSQNTKRNPRRIMFVIDVSGSMDSPATRNDGTGIKEDGYSVLDIITYSVKTIINSLVEHDYAGLITFTDDSKLIYPLTNMTVIEKSKMIDLVEKLRPLNTTNMWSGIKKSLDEIYDPLNNEQSKINTDVIVFTDGISNEGPAEGVVSIFENYMHKTNSLVSLHTIGFGNYLDSKDLIELAKIGNGNFCFIPDCGMVGTGIVNLISNILFSDVNNTKLYVEPLHGTEIKDVLGCHYFKDNNLMIGSLQIGQTKDIILKLDFRNATLDLENILNIDVEGYSQGNLIKPNSFTQNIVHRDYSGDSIDNEQKHLYFHIYRLTLTSLINENIKLMETKNSDNFKLIQNNLKEFISKVKNFISKNDVKNLNPFSTNMFVNKDIQNTKALLEDTEGQIQLALSQKYFKTWGVHYLRSILRAHLLQVCNNFKDPGVQCYGGASINNLKDEINKIFDSQKPREPSLSTFDDTKHLNLSMMSYNSQDNPCFSGDCIIQVQKNKYKTVRELLPNDTVYSMDINGNFSISKIKFIIKTNCNNKKADLVSFKHGLLITPYHPILINNNEWVFPCDTNGIRKIIPCDAVYSLILDKNHIAFINFVPTICLGHGYKKGILKHDYFGTHKVIDDIKKIQTNEDGITELYSNCLERNSEGLVNKIISKKEIISC